MIRFDLYILLTGVYFTTMPAMTGVCKVALLEVYITVTVTTMVSGAFIEL